MFCLFFLSAKQKCFCAESVSCSVWRTWLVWRRRGLVCSELIGAGYIIWRRRGLVCSELIGAGYIIWRRRGLVCSELIGAGYIIWRRRGLVCSELIGAGYIIWRRHTHKHSDHTQCLCVCVPSDINVCVCVCVPSDNIRCACFQFHLHAPKGHVNTEQGKSLDGDANLVVVINMYYNTHCLNA